MGKANDINVLLLTFFKISLLLEGKKMNQLSESILMRQGIFRHRLNIKILTDLNLFYHVSIHYIDN